MKHFFVYKIYETHFYEISLYLSKNTRVSAGVSHADASCVATDHKPLFGRIGNRNLEQVENSRLRRLKEKTKMFDFKMIHVLARKLAGPYALSRNPACREGLMGNGRQEF